jgi:hypothetical protein
MSVGVTSGPSTSADPQGRRLESWKEIASYLGRDITTVRRWEKREGLPVRPLHHSRLGTVYAYTAELDVWRRERAPGPAAGELSVTQAPPNSPPRLEATHAGCFGTGPGRWLDLVLAPAQHHPRVPARPSGRLPSFHWLTCPAITMRTILPTA